MSILRPGKLTMWVMDEKKQVGKVSIHLPTSATLANIANFTPTFTTYLDQLLYGQVIGCVYSVPCSLGAGVKAAPIAKSDIEEGVLFKFRTANDFVDVRVPAFNPFWYADNSNEVPINAAITNFQDAIISGFFSVFPCSSHGQDITSIVSRKKSIRSSRKV